ncbi:MAG: T9SS type A sorting domain-containing protein [Bacteroidales bacterium]|nr:T9SS type A sorting domain-containing protein [Bacteroidales bacterium]
MKRIFVIAFLSLVFMHFSSKSQIAVVPIGNGSIANPYQISSLDNLFWLSQNSDQWDKNFIQTADIDASTTILWDSGAGFSPIGNLLFNFRGTYNGKGFTIDALYINRPETKYIGLFGFMSEATVDSLGLTNIDYTGLERMGGIVGASYDFSEISNSFSTGTITATGDYNVGGLVGHQYYYSIINKSYSNVEVNGGVYYSGGLVGVNENNSEINNSYSTGNVSGNDRVGGLTGSCWNYGFVNNCYSTGNVSGTNNVGGLVGFSYSNSAINNSYSTGNVSGVGYVGGFVGWNYISSSITNSYSTGHVTGTTNTGGFVGNNDNTLNNSFWNTETSGQATSAGGIGKTTAQMQTLCTYIDGTDASWDFVIETANGTEDNWKMNSSANDGYPFLSWQVDEHTESCCGFIDVESPVLVVKDFTVYLDELGNACIIADSLIISAFDNCEIQDTTLSQSEFECVNLGQINVEITVSDTSGNCTTEAAFITVLDTLLPSVLCVENQIVNADNTHSYTVSGTLFDPVSIDDNCGVASVENDFNNLTTLDGAQLSEGTTTIIWTITDDGGNIVTCSFDVLVNAYVGTADLLAEGIQIFPNPTNGQFIIYSDELTINWVKIIDLTGKMIYSSSYNHTTKSIHQIDLSNFESGIYILSITTENGVYVQKIIKE